MTDPRPEELPARVRVAIVGAGFSGIGVATALLRSGEHSIAVLEKADGVGGTWRANTYPGCACDVPSVLYSFSFAPSADWSRTYSSQAEILAYLERCTDELGVRGVLHASCEVTSARWDDATATWHVATSRGSVVADVVVGAAGPLSEPRIPAVPGLDEFPGEVFHSATWRHDIDLAGLRVGVVGSGASAVQLVPHVQRVAAEVVVLQRTPPWVLPHMDRHVGRARRWARRRVPGVLAMSRLLAWTGRELLLPSFARSGGLMRLLEWRAARHITTYVRDPQLRRALIPSYRMGCKRLLLSDDWYPAITQPNATIVPHALERVDGSTLVAADGSRHEVDVIVMATGFKVTDASFPARITGRDGRTLADAWHASPQAYLGMSVAGFPNCFLMVGPNTGLGHNSIVHMIESQMRYLMRALAAMRSAAAPAIDVRQEVQDAANADLQRRLAKMVWSSGGCGSWYLAADGANRTIWPGSTWRYRRATQRFQLDRYELVAPIRDGERTD